jgi:RNA polymerase sigma-70 factor, ECF subfamily
MSTSATDTFDLDLTRSLHRLRIYALSLTGNRDSAQDLVQQTVLKALVGRSSFEPGSNFPGWIFRIQRNEFLSGLRRTRRIAEICRDLEHNAFHPPAQEGGLILRELVGALRTLPMSTRRALVASQFGGASYGEIGRRAGVSAGTVKVRVFRGRARLMQLLDPRATPPAALAVEALGDLEESGGKALGDSKLVAGGKGDAAQGKIQNAVGA